MSGLVLTPVSSTSGNSTESVKNNAASESSSEAFDEVSAREQSRLEAREQRQQRAEQRAEDQRRADQRLEEKQAEERRLSDQRAEDRQRADQQAERQTEKSRAEDARAEDRRSAERSDRADKARDDEAQTADRSDRGRDADSDKTRTAEQVSDGSRQESGDDTEITDKASLPFLFSTPTDATALKGAPSAATAVQGSAAIGGQPGTPKLSQLLDKALAAGQGASDAGALKEGLTTTAKGDQAGILLGKAATADGKAIDFSSQLAGLQGDSQSGNLQNNATSLQRGLEGRDAMAGLKSYSTSVELPVQHAEWGEKVAGKLAWLTSQRMSAAEIHITPPDLGPLEVRVQVQQDQAHVTVHATHSAVRDQLELNGHRLRDMLQENGLNLDRFEVSAETPDQQGGQQQLAGDGSGSESGGSGLASSVEGEDGEQTLAGGSLDLSWRGEVDLYA